MMRSASLVLIALLNGVVYADGLEIVNGHYTGNTITIQLTEIQKRELRNGYQANCKLMLSRKQMDVIEKGVPNKSPPTILYIYRTADIKGECTCGMANVALYSDGDSVDVICKLVMSDEDARGRVIDE